MTENTQTETELPTNLNPSGDAEEDLTQLVCLVERAGESGLPEDLEDVFTFAVNLRDSWRPEE